MPIPPNPEALSLSPGPDRATSHLVPSFRSANDATLVSGGSLGAVHRALIRTLCDAEEKELYLIADEKLLLEKLTHAKEGKEAVDEADVGGEAKRTGSLADQWESEYAARAPLDAGMVVRLRDASKLLDELSWEEVLRRLVILWEVDDDEEIDASLLDLARHLEHSEYAAAPVSLKAGALRALCDRAIDAVRSELTERAQELETAEKATRKQAAAKRKQRSDEEKEVKLAAKLRKALVVERFKDVEEAEAAVKVQEENVSKAILTREDVDGAKAELRAAQAVLKEAKQAHREAKTGGAPQQTAAVPGEGGATTTDDAPPADAPAAAPGAAEGRGVTATSRQLSKKAAEEAGRKEKAKKAEEEAVRRSAEREKREAAREVARRRRLHDALRIVPLGKDRLEARYWMVTDPDSDDDSDDEDGEEEGDEKDAARANKEAVARLIVESASGEWGEVRSIRTLREALRESHDPRDSALQVALRQAETAGAAGSNPFSKAALPTSTPLVEAAQAKLPHGFVGNGHEWIGTRVRTITRDGDWYDGRIVGWSPPSRPGDEEDAAAEELAAQMLQAAGAVKAEGAKAVEAAGEEAEEPEPAQWFARMDGVGDKTFDEEEAREAIEEAAAAGVGMLRRFLADADDDTASLDPSECKRKQPSEARATWLEQLEVASSPDSFRELMLSLEARMASVRRGELASAPASSVAAELSRLDATTEHWRARLGRAKTIGQLALRLVELEGLLLSKGGVRCGMPVQVWLVKEKEKVKGKEEEEGGGKGAAAATRGKAVGGGGGPGKFVEGRVVACFRNSSFRVRVEEADKRDASRKHVTTLELAAPGTAEGNRIVNKLWRLPPQSKEARAKRGAGGASASTAARAPPRGAAQRARAAVSKAARGADKSEDEEDGAESDSSEEADAAGSSDSDDDVEDEEDVRVPKLGETLSVFIAEGGEKGGGGRSGKKRPRGEWVTAEVVRVLRGGSFEVGVPVPAEEESSEEDDVEDEKEPTMRKIKCGLDGHDREWRYVA